MILRRDKCIFSPGRLLKQLIVFDFDGVIADSETLAKFRNDELKGIAGMRTYLDAFASVKRCIASSSSSNRLAVRLRQAGAHHVAHSYDEVEQITRQLVA